MTVTSTPEAMRWTAVVWRKVCGEILFDDKFGHFLAGGFDVMMKLKPDAGRTQLLSVSITEDWLVWIPRLSPQKSQRSALRFLATMGKSVPCGPSRRAIREPVSQGGDVLDKRPGLPEYGPRCCKGSPAMHDRAGPAKSI